MEEKRDDEATERIEEAFSRGDEGKEPGTYETDRPVMDEPQSTPDLEEAKEGDREVPLEDNEPRWSMRAGVSRTLRICPIPSRHATYFVVC